MNIEIDRFPVSDLPERYGVGRTALYERMNTLSIKSQKQGTKSYISGEQLRDLDDLDLHLKSGGGLADFLKPVQRTTSEQVSEVASQAISPSQGSMMASMMDGVIQSVIARVVPQPAQAGMRLSHLRELEEAYERKWLLSTSELADLLALSADTVRGYGEQFDEAGFMFTRAGTRSRGELAWKVGKPKQ